MYVINVDVDTWHTSLSLSVLYVSWTMDFPDRIKLLLAAGVATKDSRHFEAGTVGAGPLAGTKEVALDDLETIYIYIYCDIQYDAICWILEVLEASLHVTFWRLNPLCEGCLLQSTESTAGRCKTRRD